jgi:hypothetical protein
MIMALFEKSSTSKWEKRMVIIIKSIFPLPCVSSPSFPVYSVQFIVSYLADILHASLIKALADHGPIDILSLDRACRVKNSLAQAWPAIVNTAICLLQQRLASMIDETNEGTPIESYSGRFKFSK